MLHDVTVEGRAFRLRPIGNADAELVVKLRSDPSLNRYIHASSASVADQIAWFEQYYQRAGDYYFVVERLDNGRAEGLISVYDIDEEKTSAEWGRWLLRPGSLGAVESAWLIYRAAFEVLALESVFAARSRTTFRLCRFTIPAGSRRVPCCRAISDRRALRGCRRTSSRPAVLGRFERAA